MIQALPGASDETLKEIESMVYVLPPVSQMLAEGNTPKEIIELLFGRIPFKWSEPNPIGFFCSCSKEQMANSLLTLGPTELNELAEDQEDIEIVCDFCREEYYFTPLELQELAAMSTQ